VRTDCRSWAFVHGFVTKSAAPALMPSTASGIEPQAVIRTTGTAGHRPFSSRSSASPSSPLVWREKFMSWRTRDGASAAASASAGPAAVRTA
jgi:hypothetical protein